MENQLNLEEIRSFLERDITLLTTLCDLKQDRVTLDTTAFAELVDIMNPHLLHRQGS